MKIRLLVGLIFVSSWILPAIAQKADPDDPLNIEKGKTLIRQTIEARGGVPFLEFSSMESEGQWTPFEQGLSTLPIPFIDYLIFPDKERTEFGKGKKRRDKKINVNDGNGGWVYDGQAETLKDQSPKQIEDFKESREADLDSLLRSAMKSKGFEVKFYGREETRPGERADVIAIKSPAGRLFLLMLDPYSKLPARLAYEKSDEKGTARFEYRFNQYVAYDGVKFPNIVDLYRDGIQISRVNFQSIKLNVAIPDALFVKPAGAKDIK